MVSPSLSPFFLARRCSTMATFRPASAEVMARPVRILFEPYEKGSSRPESLTPLTASGPLPLPLSSSSPLPPGWGSSDSNGFSPCAPAVSTSSGLYRLTSGEAPIRSATSEVSPELCTVTSTPMSRCASASCRAAVPCSKNPPSSSVLMTTKIPSTTAVLDFRARRLLPARLTKFMRPTRPERRLQQDKRVTAA